ncbi:hypothetical protein Bca52824_091634 [Brassica carinata]|uniref:DUF4005 domain-containing protein n=1 Tax=Brassica carinata TaxID=52824 RepID=A0A8X7NXA6_BRACI|nr:hypothetical protein Bca52824_091634 [Brassica carinata]
MAKKKGLITILKRIFISEAHSDKKEKRRKWTFWKLKVKKRLPSITAPPENGTRHEEHNEESVSDVGEVSQAFCSENLEGSTTSPETADMVVAVVSPNREEEVHAATRIQTAFRGYLARKALRALKGIVQLQAYIRGRAVRRQAMTTLKRLQSVVNIQSQVCRKRTQLQKDYEECKMFTENLLKVDINGQKRWDNSLLTKEEARAVVMSKKEASLKRERIKEYAVTHRKSAESYQKRSNTNKWKYWLDEWVDTQRTKSKELEDLDLSLKPKPNDEILNRTPRNSSPRRFMSSNSNHRRQVSISEEEEQNLAGAVTSVRPTYMVATESAKAKSRSLMTSPRIRSRSFDTQLESYSLYINKLGLTSSVMSEAPSRVRVGGQSDAVLSKVKEKEEMSLVDYDDSSSDDDVLPSAEHKAALSQPPQQKPSPPKSRRSLNEKEEREGLPQLPDALLLLESPTLAHVSGGGDHASVVAAAMRKRDLNGNSSSLPRRPKVPRGFLPHSKNIPDTSGNLLVPPQLKGRSNVATEDMSRLFVKKRQDSSKATPPNQD